MLVFDKLAGLVAPHVCIGCGLEGEVLCKTCQFNFHEPLVPRCAGCTTLTDNFRTCDSCRSWLTPYAVYVCGIYEGANERLIKSYKFEYQRQAASAIVSIMNDVIPPLSDDIVLCCVPTAPSRIRERGFDHAQLLVNELGKLRDWEAMRLLSRKTNRRQVGSSRADRIEHMKSEFMVSNKEFVAGKTILLIDDVMTTGASLSAASKILKSAGAKRVYAAVFAQNI